MNDPAPVRLVVLSLSLAIFLMLAGYILNLQGDLQHERLQRTRAEAVLEYRAAEAEYQCQIAHLEGRLGEIQ